MSNRDRNVVLIGMPGVGKSTVGVLLAKQIGFEFVDTDLLIQATDGRQLRDIIEGKGRDAFRRLEEECIVSISSSRTVIATGGSAVYSANAMRHLKSGGFIVHLMLPLEQLALRTGGLDARGVVRLPGQTLESLYLERIPLYRQHMDAELDCSELSHELAVQAICSILASAAPD